MQRLLLLGVPVALLLFTVTPAAAQLLLRAAPALSAEVQAPPRSAPVLNDTSFSYAGDWEGGLSWNGSDRFSGAYGRYYFNDRTAIQYGGEYDRSSVDVPGTDTSATGDLINLSAGLLYEVRDEGLWRAYLRPGIGYEKQDFDNGLSQSGFFGELALGADVRLTRGLALGLQSGIKYSTFSNDFGGSDAGDGNKIWLGKQNLLNLTLRFPNLEPE